MFGGTTYIFMGVVAVLVAGVLLLLWMMRRQAAKNGALVEDNKTQGDALDDIQKADAARDRLRSDPDYARSVRDKYSRD